ncbi:Lysophospholipase L1 [Pasteurella testudinis DSM 23072]|uniref:Lysophospholipase L1 n=1 Tax=Pasteurella testudinis DSM 23072 TaxID=1122938 RepID=A0A1W1UAQ7_9PAST|nr:GDSL-type esterase/lipase family protein [Pasteurella testudinis]SMB78157.1 Lysophospholipase L1 [Pasteurella testudinis DSM 23072]SUB52666.1 GDSL-like Lipase/Acylhydrolase [Pasteurella testudinis]
MALKEILQFIAENKQQQAEAFLINFSAQRREMMVERYNSLHEFTRPGQIVLLGDSITEEFPIHEMLPELTIYNRGISGNDTYDVLNRLAQHIYPLQPRKLFLLIGVNDLAKYPNDTPLAVSQRVEQIIRNLQTHLPDCELHLSSVLPVNQSQDPKIDQVMLSLSDNRRIIALNHHLRPLAEKCGVVFIDLHPHFVNHENELALAYTREGLHLTLAGYQVFLRELLPYLQR